MAKNPMALSEFVSDEQLDKVLKRVELNSNEVDAVVQQIVDEYCDRLDEIMDEIDKYLHNHDNVPNSHLEHFVVSIPNRLYWVCDAAENLGVRDDVSRLLYREAYNNARRTAEGTVADKDTIAALHTHAEALTAVVYSRAAKMVKAKLDNAYEMLAALKKVMSVRIAEHAVADSDRRN